LIAGRSRQEILAAANTTHDQVPAAKLQGFVDSLLAEQLIRRALQGGSAASTPLAPIALWPEDSLRFERFTDMQDLLILDPIHEVDDEAGWPKPAG
jgi:hypothetical protein